MVFREWARRYGDTLGVALDSTQSSTPGDALSRVFGRTLGNRLTRPTEHQRTETGPVCSEREFHPLRNILLMTVVLILASANQPCRGVAEDSPPASPLSRQELSDVIARLGDSRFSVRQASQQQLVATGEQWLPIADELEIPSDPEVRWRFNDVLRFLRRGPFVGTQWYLVCSPEINLPPSTITLYDEGRLTQDGRGSSSPDDDFWETSHDGNKLSFSFNSRYAVYEGTRQDGYTIIGKAHNIKGKSWTWTATLVTKD